MLARSLVARAQKVCDALVMFGLGPNRTPFVSHPGVMAVAQLLEMKSLVEYRAHFTQENVNEMLEHDAELAEKAQVAVDHNLPISHYNLDYLDQPGFLETLLEERDLNREIAQEVLNAPKGKYDPPKSLAKYKAPEIPLEWRQHEVAMTHEMVDVQPELLREMETQRKMREFMASQTNVEKERA